MQYEDIFLVDWARANGGTRIEAIKAVRAELGTDLKQSKRIVEMAIEMHKVATFRAKHVNSSI